MAGKKHRSYLDDFQRDVNGEYQYRGAHYRYAGTMEYQTLRRSLWLCCGFGTALVLAAGCLPGATAGAAWYVTLPTMLALAACGFLLWTLARWTKGGMTLRAYVHAQTVKRLPAEGQGQRFALHIEVALVGDKRFDLHVQPSISSA